MDWVAKGSQGYYAHDNVGMLMSSNGHLCYVTVSFDLLPMVWQAVDTPVIWDAIALITTPL